MSECLEIYLRSVYQHKVSDWGSDSGIPFLIGAGARTDAMGTVTIKGEMMSPSVGERYRLWGEWKDEPKYGNQSFAFFSFEILIKNTVDGLTDYLDRHIFGLGEIRSRDIVEHFGSEDCLKVLRTNPERLLEVKGIGPKIAAEITQHFRDNLCPVDPAAYAAVYDLLSESSPPRKIMTQILQDFGSSADSVIRDNPYILMSYQGLGWTKVDQIATKKVKYDSDGIERHRAAVLETLERFANDGDTIVSQVELECRASKELGVNISDEAYESLDADRLVVFTRIEGIKRERYDLSLMRLYSAEQEIAFRLKGLMDSFGDPTLKIDTTGLEGEQIEACHFIEKHPVSILVGAPGTGKTFTITKFLKTLYRHGHKIILVAPTGKAAKRADEVLTHWLPDSGIKVSTVHRALGVAPSGAGMDVPESHAKFNRGRERFGFEFGAENPLDINDGIADEVSMFEVELMLAWLRAIPPGARLIFVGDPNQLPSVGPGAVLRDMIDGGIPTFTLDKPRRNSGRIVLACHAIKNGKIPDPSPEFDPENGENWIHIEESNPAKIAKIIVGLHDKTDRNPMWDLQVISPQIEKPEFICCDDLNNMISLKLNPKRAKFSAEDENRRRTSYYPGDKVVRTKNGFVEIMIPVSEEGHRQCTDKELYGQFVYDNEGDFEWNHRDYFIKKTYVVNGDIGQVLDIGTFGRQKFVIVRFRNPDKLCRLPVYEAHLSLANCITVHKAQGSGFPVAIMPVHSSYYWDHRNQSGIWHREEFYTMISRAIDVAITVGEFSAIGLAIGRKTSHKRRTNLVSFLKEALSKKILP